MNGGPKDNANPEIVVAVQQKRVRTNLIGWNEIQRMSADDNDVVSAQDRAVLQALADVASATNGEGVALLRKVGVKIPESSTSSTNASFLLPLGGPPASEESSNASQKNEEEKQRDALDSEEIYDIIRNIQDPEHPLTLEQLGVVSREQIEVYDTLDHPDSADLLSTCSVRFTPTVPHCSMATLIGLSIRVKLMRSLPPRFKLKVMIEPGTHQSEKSVNKQLADKERVYAALENPHLRKVVNRCIANGMKMN